ncbi:hypothetical protein PFISCL1PPCAC_7785, partial [Pristionchus fissidentatus]
LVDFPPEILESIFKFVGESATITMRGVCRKTKTFVDTSAAARKPVVKYIKFVERDVDDVFYFEFRIHKKDSPLFAVGLCDLNASHQLNQ